MKFRVEVRMLATLPSQEIHLQRPLFEVPGRCAGDKAVVGEGWKLIETQTLNKFCRGGDIFLFFSGYHLNKEKKFKLSMLCYPK